jgi:myo-inositol-1(or 4)-monophosphatase
LPGSGLPPGPRSRELDVAIAAAREAGAIAIEHFGRGGWETKADFSIVTAADRECESAIRARIVGAFPGANVLGEETSTAEGMRALARGDAWVIDPIDGTAGFTAQLPTFGVSVGLLREGEPVLGAIYLPRTDELYAADFQGDAFWGDRPARTKAPEEVDARTFLCVTSTSHFDYRLKWPGKTRSLGSTALHVVLVARGAAVGAILEPAVWDVAAAIPILRRAGGDIYELESGERLDVPAWVRDGAHERALLACAPGSLEPLRSVIAKKKR